jgi:Leucine-rich repeat (LRR) protein
LNSVPQLSSMISMTYFVIFFLAIHLTISESPEPAFDLADQQQITNHILFKIYNGSLHRHILLEKSKLGSPPSLPLQQMNGHKEDATNIHAQRRSTGQQKAARGNDDRKWRDHVSPKATGPCPTGNKPSRIRETSETLIKRLCSVKASKRHLCYKRGSSECYCTGGLADCSGKLFVPNISYIPKLPSNIKCLNFSLNSMTHLIDSYFTNVSKFVVIDFSSNKLEAISPKTFERFSNLQYLILNDNNIGYAPLKKVLDYPPLLRLDIIRTSLQKVPPGYFDPYRTIPTSEIYMDGNYIPTLDLQEFSKLENLKYLSLTSSYIVEVISAQMPCFKVLDLDNNCISRFPVTCSTSMSNNSSASNNIYLDYHDVTSEKQLLRPREFSSQIKEQYFSNTSFSLLPALTDLYFGHNNLSALRDEICLPRLKTLHLESNKISTIKENTFMAFSSLKVLTMDRMNSGITKIEKSAFNISTLTSLYLSKNQIVFSSSDISSQLFQGCFKLEVLSIDHNHLGGMSEDLFEEMLNNTPALKFIYLSSTNMNFVPVKAFSQLRNIERLYIYVNEIKEIPPGAFDEMPSLRYIYMDENEISTIQENVFSSKTRLRLKVLNLSKNEYLCDCDLLWFQSWLVKAGPALFMEFDNYRCSNINNMSVQSFVLNRQACLFRRTTYILFVVCLSIIMVLFIVFAILYRYRWNIRLMIYETRTSHRNPILLSEEEHYRYDFFVLYCNDDSEWVEDQLLPKLETKWRMQACIHQRDFVAGGFIIDNIVESMNASKRILVVISSRFALSKWCNFELMLCQSHVITHNLPSLLVIHLEEVESRDMSAALLALYKTTSFLAWPVHSSDSWDTHRDKFWKRLERSLINVIGHRSQNTSVKCVG